MSNGTLVACTLDVPSLGGCTSTNSSDSLQVLPLSALSLPLGDVPTVG
jgi:hypothetical protein